MQVLVSLRHLNDCAVSAHKLCLIGCKFSMRGSVHHRGVAVHPAEKAFFPAEYAHTVPKMGFDDVVDGIFWIDDHFHLILPPLDEMPSIDYILDKARAAVLRSALLRWGSGQGCHADYDRQQTLAAVLRLQLCIHPVRPVFCFYAWVMGLLNIC